MLQDVDETLQRLLAAELAQTPGCPIFHPSQIAFDPPASAEAAQDGEAHVNLYLHDVRENLRLRDESYRTVRSPGKRMPFEVERRRAMVYLDLSYLVTVYAGDDPALEHRLLSDVLRVMLRYLAVPEQYLAGLLEGKGSNALLLAVAQPDHAAYTDPPGLWQALGGRLRPALSLVATGPFDPLETKWTKIVREAFLGMVPGTDPHTAPWPKDEDMNRVVAGLVLDADNEEPLAEAEVSLEGMAATISDERGFFYLRGLPSGTHTLRVRRGGYGEAVYSFVTARAGDPEHLEPPIIGLRRLTDKRRFQRGMDPPSSEAREGGNP
jgi:hypothetical protein